MKEDDVVKNAFAMPLTSPSYPRGPYRFVNREYFIVSYRTDMDALRAVVPEPLQLVEPIAKYEFIVEAIFPGELMHTIRTVPDHWICTRLPDAGLSATSLHTT